MPFPTHFHPIPTVNRLTNSRPPHSASPLNAQAAELWDTDKEEFKRLVLARHRDIEEIE